MSTTSSKDFIDTMEKWFDQAPKLPKNWQEILVKITPILALIFGILGILLGLSGLGTLFITSPIAALGGAHVVGAYGTGFVSVLIYLVASILLLAAYPGTKAKKAKGWNLLFWSEVVNVIGGLFAMAIISAIIGALIGFYLLFQIRPYYK